MRYRGRTLSPVRELVNKHAGALSAAHGRTGALPGIGESCSPELGKL